MKLATQACLAAALLAAPLVLTATAGAQEVLGEPPAAFAQPKHAKVASDISALAESLGGMARSSRAELLQAASQGGSHSFRLRGENLDRLETYVFATELSDTVREKLRRLGVELDLEDADRSILSCWIPLDQIEAVASLPEVRMVRRPAYAITAAGIIQTRGDEALGTNWIRTLGQVGGQGIRVGVLSVGLFDPGDSLDITNDGSNADIRVITGDLPRTDLDPPADPDSFGGPTSGYLGGVRIFPDTVLLHEIGESSSDGTLLPTQPEGGAILETVFDIAPGSELFYADASHDVALNAGRNFLVGRGVDVIVDDTAFIGSGRLDGTSAISRRAREIVLIHNIPYITAAGNFTTPPETDQNTSVSANRFPLFINGFFSPRAGLNAPKYHNWAWNYPNQVRDEGLTIFSQDGLIDVAVIWDDVWDDDNPRATDDLDLYLVPDDGTSLDLSTPIATSVDVQNRSGFPMERITIPDLGARRRLVLSRKGTLDSSPRLFTLVILRGTVVFSDSHYLTHGVPLNNGDALPPVITVGGIDSLQTIDRIVEESVPGISPGPGLSISNSFITWFIGQTSPAVVSYTNTENLSVGTLTGSSGGAAHIGGLMALLRHAYRDIPAWEWYDYLRDTSTSAEKLFPNATVIEEDRLEGFGNAPAYYRVNGFDTFLNIALDRMNGAVVQRSSYLSTVGALEEWSHSGEEVGYTAPEYGTSAQGLTISAGGKKDVFGFWQSPLFTFQDSSDAEARTELRPDRMYELSVRIGSDEADAMRVPSFRLRLITGANDEAATLVVNGLDPETSASPTSISGREYRLYYRPTSDAIARQGVRFAFDLLHFEESDNAAATFYIQSVKLRELPLSRN